MSSTNEMSPGKSEFERNMTAVLAEIEAALDLLSLIRAESLTADETREVLEQLNYLRAPLDAIERKLLDHVEAHGIVLPRPATERDHAHSSPPGAFTARTGSGIRIRP